MILSSRYTADARYAHANQVDAIEACLKANTTDACEYLVPGYQQARTEEQAKGQQRSHGSADQED